MRDIIGVIYDLDNTALNNGLLSVDAWDYTLKKQDIYIPQGFMEKQQGITTQEALKYLPGISEEQKKIIEVMKTRYILENTNSAMLSDSFIETVRYLKSKNITSWICTSASKTRVDSTIDLIPELEEFREKIVCKEHYTSGKPSAEPILVTIRKMGPFNPAKYVYVGDSEADYKAATAAGCNFIHYSNNTHQTKMPPDVYVISNHSEIRNWLEK